jgi:cystathionine beta-lyase/cystathionine gamma-synthase
VFESPTNPVLKVADIERITRLARAHGTLTLLDNTLAGFHNHGQFDVDIYAHSLTKYASGHGDVMGGAIIARKALIDAMRDDVAILGPTLDPHAAFLLLRGMKTYYVRWDAQCRNAQAIAEHLSQHPAVARVRYPGLPGDPGHGLAITASLGSTESLVMPPALHQPRGFTAEQRQWSDIGPGTVRLSVGLEDLEDLVVDLDRALRIGAGPA